MNRVGVSFAYWQHTWMVDMKACLARAKKTGMQALEIMPGALLELPDDELASIRALSKEYDIELTMGVTLNAETDISSPDAAVRAAGIAFMKNVLAVMNKLDCKIINGLVYGQWGGKIKELAEKPQRTEQSVASIKEIIGIVENDGVQFCLEVVNRFEQYMLNTAAEAVEFAKMVGSSNMKIALDTFHMNIEENSMPEAIRTAGSYLGHFHAGENNRRVPGTGTMDWDGIVGALKETGYQKSIVMEPFLLAGGDVGNDVALWRDLSGNATDEQMDEMIMQGAAFLRGKLQ